VSLWPQSEHHKAVLAHTLSVVNAEKKEEKVYVVRTKTKNEKMHTCE